MARSDAQLAKQVRRVQRRLERVQRKQPERADRIERLTGRLQHLEAMQALPPDERPAALRLSPAVVQGALDAALLVASLTPAGPALKGLTLGVGALKKVDKAIRQQDLGGALDGLVGAVRDELSARGIPVGDDDELLASLTDALEERLDRDA